MVFITCHTALKCRKLENLRASIIVYRMEFPRTTYYDNESFSLRHMSALFMLIRLEDLLPTLQHNMSGALHADYGDDMD